MTSKPPVFTWNEELHFGPPSNPIDIQKFVDDAQNLQLFDVKAITEQSEWHDLPGETKASIEEACVLDNDISSLTAVFSSQKHMHYLQTVHADAVSQLGIMQPFKRNKGKGKQPASHEDHELDKLRIAEVVQLRAAAKPYIRTGRVSDQNALDSLKFRDPDSQITVPVCSHEALITLTIYTRNSWYPYAFSRDSQLVLLSENTLADLWSCVPCVSRENSGTIPGEVLMVAEGVVYSSAHGPIDYADKLLSHLQRFKAHKRTNCPSPLPLGPYERPTSMVPPIKGPFLEAVRLRSLTLRINEPYWILHLGACEHWFVVDEIRLRNPHDPPTGYPIELQRTPVARPLCRICSKVLATLSVLNDIRLGESPALVCQSCWDCFGGPPPSQNNDSVIVIPVVFKT